MEVPSDPPVPNNSLLLFRLPSWQPPLVTPSSRDVSHNPVIPSIPLANGSLQIPITSQLGHAKGLLTSLPASCRPHLLQPPLDFSGVHCSKPSRDCLVSVEYAAAFNTHLPVPSSSQTALSPCLAHCPTIF